MDEKSSIIIVDNDRVLLSMLKEGLKSEGYRCEVTSNAGTALESIGETPFDILVTDIVMPGLDGFELTEKAKKIRPDITVIMMTGFIDDFSYDRALEAGASDFIKKPFTLKEIKIRLQHVRLREKLRETSITDEVTGLCNRKGFFILADQQLKLARRYKKGLFMLHAVLNNFEAISEAFGHQGADQALVDTAALLKATYREADLIARIAKDRFVVCPVGFTGDNVRMITDCLQENVDRHNAKKDCKCKLSVRFGTIHCDPGNPCSLDELLAYGDALTDGQKKPNRKT
jgi:diguanylate cyclase (GGDEF)-like protein